MLRSAPPEQQDTVRVFLARSGIAAMTGRARKGARHDGPARKGYSRILPEAYRDLGRQREGERAQGRVARTRAGPRLRPIEVLMRETALPVSRSRGRVGRSAGGG